MMYRHSPSSCKPVSKQTSPLYVLVVNTHNCRFKNGISDPNENGFVCHSASWPTRDCSPCTWSISRAAAHFSRNRCSVDALMLRATFTPLRTGSSITTGSFLRPAPPRPIFRLIFFPIAGQNARQLGSN